MKYLALLGLALILLLGCTTTAPVNCVNVTCNGVVTCRAPNDIPPCVPPVPNTTNATQNTTCPDGYICGIPSNGCAVPGAIYNCPNQPVNITNSTMGINPAEELNNSAGAGFNLTQAMFYANSSSQCSKQLISACDNNVPTQFICVNQQYAGNVSAQYAAIYSRPWVCPQFMLAGKIFCGLEGDNCVVLYQGPN